MLKSELDESSRGASSNVLMMLKTFSGINAKSVYVPTKSLGVRCLFVNEHLCGNHITERCKQRGQVSIR